MEGSTGTLGAVVSPTTGNGTYAGGAVAACTGATEDSVETATGAADERTVGSLDDSITAEVGSEKGFCNIQCVHHTCTGEN